MISYEQSTSLVLGSPSIHGHYDFFVRNCLQRPETRVSIFKIYLSSASYVKIGPDGTILLKSNKNSNYTNEVALTKDNRIFNFEDVEYIDDPFKKNAYLFVPNQQRDIYGHWLIDIIPRAVIAKKILTDYQIKFLYQGKTREFVPKLIKEFGFEASDLENVSDLISGEDYNFLNISPTREHDYINPLVFKNLVPAPKLNVNSTIQNLPSHIYVSRGMWKTKGPGTRTLKNYEEIEALFVKKGFTILYPEQYSIKDQVTLFSKAKVVAGEAGSGLHNSIFMPAGTTVINIQSGRQTHLIQASLCKIFGQNIDYALGIPESNDWQSNYQVDPSIIENALSKYL